MFCHRSIRVTWMLSSFMPNMHPIFLQLYASILSVRHCYRTHIIFAQILDEEFAFSPSCSVCLQHNELPEAPLALSPGTLPSADPDCSSLTRTFLHLWEKMTRNTIQPIGWLLQPETNALAINPCCWVDKLIACTAISSPVSNREELSVRVILQQMGIVSECKAGRMVTLDK